MRHPFIARAIWLHRQLPASAGFMIGVLFTLLVSQMSLHSNTTSDRLARPDQPMQLADSLDSPVRLAATVPPALRYQSPGASRQTPSMAMPTSSSSDVKAQADMYTDAETAQAPASTRALAAALSITPRELDEALVRFSKEARRMFMQPARCKLLQFGSDWGTHPLCEPLNVTRKDCVFYSFGIGGDFSFDSAFANRFNCRGFLYDPSSTMQSKVAPKLWYMEYAANILRSEQDGSSFMNNWVVTSPPQVRLSFNHSIIEMLKMDCEGCEFALAGDVLQYDPDFFSRVKQFTIELHVTRAFAPDRPHADGLAALWVLLERSGFILTFVPDSNKCAPHDMNKGCNEHMAELDFFFCATMCHNMLWVNTHFVQTIPHAPPVPVTFPTYTPPEPRPPQAAGKSKRRSKMP